MKIEKGYPPNFELIKAALPHAAAHHAYCYGDKIYVPDGHELPADIIFHEAIHSGQQGDNPNGWWYSYLTNPEFRLAQEIAAYGEQYLFAKNHIKHNGARRWMLESMARALSGLEYGNLIGYNEAEAKIRNYGKSKETSQTT